MGNKKTLEGKVAIVTGGASGIGETAARVFANLGARAVVIADIQSELGREVAESIGAKRCSYVQCDIGDEEQVKSMVEWTATTYGALDVMFCNAGIMSKAESAQTVLELDMSKFDEVMRVNTRGTSACVKQAARKMVELGTKGGAIVCTSSPLASRGGYIDTDYVMSKHAVMGLVRSASMQLGAHGIRVNSVSPMAVLTPLTRRMGLATPADVENAFGRFTSLKGVALTAEHVAEAAAFLASDEAAFITGHDLMVDGGLLCLPFFAPTS
uniref:(+)-cis,trans-nepetalactol synthase NEPS2 n=1 Tax=Nepeta racemosa TaxID=54731 RepID=NEPS2_NEPRA|nr:RecName: Full=(+)-cis,trans-nepetalactol synthase NEPS2; AltName: Full=Nepetalactol-related short-chain reductase 2; Short=NmNEPS2 [Nepeta racemosa]AXF35972.1 cis-trans-nepetalactol synthase [Nepeta racemosa]